MSRFAGEMLMLSFESNTTVSPMVMRPSVGVSSPAIMRRVVVLPQPEGPRSVMNSRSSMTMLRS